MAQLVEQRIRNAWVGGSSPPIGSNRRNAFVLLFRFIIVLAHMHFIFKRVESYENEVYYIRL